MEYDEKNDTVRLVRNMATNMKKNSTDKFKYNKTSAKNRGHLFRTRSYKIVVSDKK